MNKLGVHALVWEAGWSHDDCARAIAKTAEVGYDFIEAPALDPGSIDVDFTRRQLEANGIGINFSLGLDADTDISSGDRDDATVLTWTCTGVVSGKASIGSRRKA